MKKRSFHKKTTSAAICLAAALSFGHAASAENAVKTTAIEKAFLTLPPFPQQLLDEVSFGKRVPGPYAYYNMCRQPADAFRCALDKRPEPAHKPRTLTREDWVDLHHVLKELHKNFKTMTDLEKHGKIDVWTHNYEGDCEDFAWLFKRILTERFGWKEHELLMGVVLDENNAGHAAMVIRTDRGYWVADVRRNHFRRMEETNYRPVMIQNPANRYEWASIKGRKVFAEKPAWQSYVSSTPRKKGPSRTGKPKVALKGPLS